MKVDKSNIWKSWDRHKIVQSSSSKRILLLPRSILENTRKIFLEYYTKNQESVAYWYGLENVLENTDTVLSLAVPKAYHSSGNFQVSADESARIGRNFSRLSFVCLAQIHTHPGNITAHSYYDDENAMSRRDGFLSLVVPNYGNATYHNFNQIAIHESWKGKWEILEDSAKDTRIVIVDDFLDYRVKDLE